MVCFVFFFLCYSLVLQCIHVHRHRYNGNKMCETFYSLVFFFYLFSLTWAWYFLLDNIEFLYAHGEFSCTDILVLSVIFFFRIFNLKWFFFLYHSIPSFIQLLYKTGKDSVWIIRPLICVYFYGVWVAG